MPVNKGIAPPDKDSLVGKFRFTYGDSKWVELDPVEVGFGNYTHYSDDEIEAKLAAADGSIFGAVALAYFELARDAAIEAKSVKDYDLQVSTEKRATELRLLAQQWQAKADAESAEVFELFLPDQGDVCYPELAMRPYGGPCGF